MTSGPDEELGQRGAAAEGPAELGERIARLEAQMGPLVAEIAALRDELRSLRTERNEGPVPGVSVMPSFSQPLPLPPPIPARRVAPAARTPFVERATSSARNQSLESQLGAKVLSKVAVVLLLVGAAWFLKWAFDNRWIGPQGRVLTGLVAGVGVVLWSEHFRRQKMDAFSYALKAVGSGVLYLSLWASFQLYHLIPAPIAFAAMVAVAAWNAFMSWSQDSLTLAAYALLGAYLTPLLVSSGGDHEIFLFSYLLVIAASLAALLRVKPWNILLVAALPATTGFFIAWYVEFFSPSKANLTLGFSLLLWCVFAVIPLLAKNEDVLVTVLAPLSTAVFGALTLYSVLVDSGLRDWEPWCAVGLAALYLVMTRLRGGMIAALHLSLAIVFLTIAIPLKATGHGITLGWLVEAVALLAIAARASLEDRAQWVLRWLGWGALLLGSAGAMAGPTLLAASQRAFLNRDFATSLAAVAALSAAMFFAARMNSTGESRLSGPVLIAGSLIVLNLVLLVAMYREIFLAFTALPDASGVYHNPYELADFAFSAWMTLQGAALLAVGFWKRTALARWLGLVLLAATVIKTVAYDMRSLGTGYRVASYLVLGVLLMAISFAYQKDWLGLRGDEDLEPDQASANEADA